MDGNLFDRLTATLVSNLQRRDAVRRFAVPGLAALVTRLGGDLDAAKAKKKKRNKKKKPRCRTRRQTCGGRAKCCGGNTACRSFPTATCLTLSGRRCCGLEGAPCNNDPAINNCDCCSDLYCGGLPGQPGKCQEDPS